METLERLEGEELYLEVLAGDIPWPKPPKL
jgi:hypothetical protein